MKKSTVDTQHEDYQEYQEQWKLCRNLAEGQCAVHKAGVKYLPMLKNELGEDYAARKGRTTLYNAYWRTVSGLIGMLFKRQPVIEVDASLEEMMKDINLKGMSLETFAQEIVEESLVIGRVGVLVDFPAANTEGMTEADVSKLNLRPTLQKYESESIINWKMGLVNNKYILTLIVLTEEFDIPKNEFESECETRYRVLDLSTGVYRQRVFRINDKGEDELLSEFYPVMRGKNLDYIPFQFIGAENLTSDIDAPPLIDMADLNIAHYKVSADYEHGCHFTGLPTPWIAGYRPPEGSDNLYIGSSTAWVFSDPSAKAEFLEFKGTGLTALESNLSRKEQQMAILGARMLAQDKKMVESADTASIHRAGENSILAAIAANVSEGLSRSLIIFSQWTGGSDNASIEINKDYLNMPLSAQELTAMVAAWQAGAISQQTLFYNLKSGEMYPDNITFEDEQSMIEATAPVIQPIPKAII
jgi:hypothetical protein